MTSPSTDWKLEDTEKKSRPVWRSTGISLKNNQNSWFEGKYQLGLAVGPLLDHFSLFGNLLLGPEWFKFLFFSILMEALKLISRCTWFFFLNNHAFYYVFVFWLFVGLFVWFIAFFLVCFSFITYHRSITLDILIFFHLKAHVHRILGIWNTNWGQPRRKPCASADSLPRLL